MSELRGSPSGDGQLDLLSGVDQCPEALKKKSAGATWVFSALGP